MAASASHVVATFVFLDSEFAFPALLYSLCFDPQEECLIAFFFASLNLSLRFFLAKSFLILLASLTLVIDSLASIAVRNLATWAVMAKYFILFFKAIEVTIVCGALEVVTRLFIPDHLPLMTSPADKFLELKNLFEVSVS